MKKFDFGQTITILANLGVVAGLVFVGFQLQQEREIAQADRILLNSAGYRNWAELVTDNSELWAKGLAGEPLSAEEALAFDALASAREGSMYAAWRSAVLTGQSGALADSLVREQAREFSSHPGLVKWWNEHTQRMRELGRPTEHNELVDAEIGRMQQEESASSR